MNILIPVAAYHAYNTAVYVERAFKQLGHEARVITQGEFYQDHPDADLFFGVDSAGPLDFPEKHLPKTVMWFIDSRHNNDPARRVPDDDTNAARIAKGGGWVFQAQRPDWQRNVEQGVVRSIWLPLAADPDIWRPHPGTEKIYDVGFGGNVWCQERRDILDRIARKWKLESFTGMPEVLAEMYARSRVGFNVSTFYGTDVAYDVNMRVFEVLACGIPLVTNHLPDLERLGIIPEHHCATYVNPDAAMSRIRLSIQRGEQYRQEMGERARQLILDAHTYAHRMEDVLGVLEAAGALVA